MTTTMQTWQPDMGFYGEICARKEDGIGAANEAEYAHLAASE